MGRAMSDVVALHVLRLQHALATMHGASATLPRSGDLLVLGSRAGNRVLVAGNGGSAPEAQHLTAELVGWYTHDRPPLSAITLHADTSTLTALANDYGVDEMFARQVRAHGQRGDTLVAMSTSGRSTNLVAAASVARELGPDAWAIAGATPNPLADKASEVISCRAEATATIQEIHLVSLHFLCTFVDDALARDQRVIR